MLCLVEWHQRRRNHGEENWLTRSARTRVVCANKSSRRSFTWCKTEPYSLLTITQFFLRSCSTIKSKESWISSKKRVSNNAGYSVFLSDVEILVLSSASPCVWWLQLHVFENFNGFLEMHLFVQSIYFVEKKWFCLPKYNSGAPSLLVQFKELYTVV